jgi:ornithine carbamoyltransferase
LKIQIEQPTTKVKNMKKDLVSMLDLQGEIDGLMDLAIDIKKRLKNNESYLPLKNKSLAMIFEKPSTRTRVSFEVGMTKLGGHALYLSPKDLQIGRGETVSDTARVLSRFVDAIMYRGFSHDTTIELAASASIPVINGLDDLEHPCQILADLLTIKEHKGDFKELSLTYLGDGNNVCNSMLLGCAMVGMNITVGSPYDYLPSQKILEEASDLAIDNGSHVYMAPTPEDAVKNADVIYTDVWVSMGDETETAERLKTFQPFQVNEELLSHAKSDCIVMHCLPAHRGQEITDEVVDGKHSVVFDQAENRMHAQNALLVKLIGEK